MNSHSTSSYIVNQGSTIRFFNSQTGNFCGEEKLPKGFEFDEYQRCRNSQISPEEIVLGDSEGNLFARNLFTGKEMDLEKNHKIKISCTDASMKNKLMLSASCDFSAFESVICLWNVEEKKLIKKFENVQSNSIESVLFLKDTNLFASGSTDCSVKVFDFLKLKELKTFYGVSTVMDLSFEPQYKLLSCCSAQSEISIFDIKEMKLTNRIKKNLFDGELKSILSFDENCLFAGDRNGKLYCLDIRKLKQVVYKETLHPKSFLCRILKNDSESILTGGDYFIKMVDKKNGKELLKLKDKEVVDGFCLFSSENCKREEEFLPQFKDVKEEKIEKLLNSLKNLNTEYDQIYDWRFFKYPTEIEKDLKKVRVLKKENEKIRSEEKSKLGDGDLENEEYLSKLKENYEKKLYDLKEEYAQGEVVLKKREEELLEKIENKDRVIKENEAQIKGLQTITPKMINKDFDFFGKRLRIGSRVNKLVYYNYGAYNYTLLSPNIIMVKIEEDSYIMSYDENDNVLKVMILGETKTIFEADKTVIISKN